MVPHADKPTEHCTMSSDASAAASCVTSPAASMPVSVVAASPSLPSNTTPASPTGMRWIQPRRQTISRVRRGGCPSGIRSPQGGIRSKSLRTRCESVGLPGTTRTAPGHPWDGTLTRRADSPCDARSRPSGGFAAVWQPAVAHRGTRISRWSPSTSWGQPSARSRSSGDPAHAQSATADDRMIR